MKIFVSDCLVVAGRNGSDSDTQRRNISDSPHHQPPPPFGRPPPRLGVGVELPPGIRQMAGPAIQLPRGGEILRPPAEAGIDLAVLAALAGNSPVRNIFLSVRDEKS